MLQPTKGDHHSDGSQSLTAVVRRRWIAIIVVTSFTREPREEVERISAYGKSQDITSGV